jgi:hypothetical protein
MTDWYYAKNGQQFGPVSLVRLQEMARAGELDPARDLVWNSSLPEWTPAGKVDAVFGLEEDRTPAPPSDGGGGLNPYAAPRSLGQVRSEPAATPTEIEPGSDPIDLLRVVQRSWEITIRNYGVVFLTWFVFLGITMILALVLKAVDVMVGYGGIGPVTGVDDLEAIAEMPDSPWSIVINQVVSMFLTLGMTRVGLNLASGQPADVGQLFGEGGKLLRLFGASLLYGLMVVLAGLLLIVPGIYLGIRYGQFMTAMVDKDLGILESLSYSSRLTTNNKWNLVGLFFLALGVIVAGLLAFCVGIFVAYPMVWMMAFVAYRWMQYGSAGADLGTGRS